MYKLPSYSIRPLIFLCTSHPTQLFIVLFFTLACTLFFSLFIWLITAPPFIYITVCISYHAGTDPWGGWVNGKCHLKIPHPQSLPLPLWLSSSLGVTSKNERENGRVMTLVQLHILRENVMCLKCCWARRDTWSYCLWKGREYFCIESRCEHTHMHIHTFS